MLLIWAHQKKTRELQLPVFMFLTIQNLKVIIIKEIV